MTLDGYWIAGLAGRAYFRVSTRPGRA